VPIGNETGEIDWQSSGPAVAAWARSRAITHHGPVAPSTPASHNAANRIDAFDRPRFFPPTIGRQCTSNIWFGVAQR